MKNEKYDCLLEILGEGKENAVSGSELAVLLNRSKREVSELVHEARTNGLMVVSDSCGYYVPKNDDEILACYNRLRKHSISQLASMKVFRKYLKARGLLENVKSS